VKTEILSANTKTKHRNGNEGTTAVSRAKSKQVRPMSSCSEVARHWEYEEGGASGARGE